MERKWSEIKVWVNGSFDVLHIGHIRLLEHANKLGRVRVGIDTDRRITDKKGSNRPFNNLDERIEFLKSIKYVDSIVTFNSDQELENQIKLYQPEIMVIGGDYEKQPIIGSQYIKEIVFFERIENKSTSKILSHDKSIGGR